MANRVACRKVGPARHAKSNHRFVKAKVRDLFTIEEIQSVTAMQLPQDPESSPVPEGSVEDGDRELTPTPANNESGTVPVSTLVFNTLHDSPTELFRTMPLSSARLQKSLPSLQFLMKKR
jgi:hypothetical protein